MSTQLSTQKNNSLSFNFFDAEQFAVMQRVSTMFSNSELVPDMYKVSDKVTAAKATANCMIALSLAQRMGADALMVMQNLVIIYGRPSWSSKFLIATVNTCGRFDTLKYKRANLGKVGKIEITAYVWNPQTRKKDAVKQVFDGSEIDNFEMVAYTKEKGDDEILESSPVSIKMAIEEGWYTKDGSKWKTMPEKMMKYRAASFWTNEYAPEISMGMKTEEEVYDIEDTEYVEVFDKSVKDTIAANANKTPIEFTDSQAPVEAQKSAIQPNESFNEPAKAPSTPEVGDDKPKKAPF